jgi:hypothetical protein
MQLSWTDSPQSWAAIAKRSPRATFFHSPAWAEAVAAIGLATSQALLADLADGRQAAMISGIRPCWRGLVKAARSGMNGGYGGVIATGPLTPIEQRQMYKAFRQRFPETAGSANPFDDPPPADAGFTLLEATPTRIIRLAPLPELRQRYNRERKRAVARYQERGVQVAILRSPSATDRRTFYRLYQLEVDAWREQGRSLHLAHSEAWFEALFRAAPDQMRLAMATIDGMPVGGLIYADHGKIVSELYLAWDRAFADDQISTALKEACLADCADRGLSIIDFMSSGNLAGVDRFKQSFGAEPLPVWEFHHQSLATQVLSALRPRIAVAGQAA